MDYSLLMSSQVFCSELFEVALSAGIRSGPGSLCRHLEE